MDIPPEDTPVRTQCKDQHLPETQNQDATRDQATLEHGNCSSHAKDEDQRREDVDARASQPEVCSNMIQQQNVATSLVPYSWLLGGVTPLWIIFQCSGVETSKRIKTHQNALSSWPKPQIPLYSTHNWVKPPPLTSRWTLVNHPETPKSQFPRSGGCPVDRNQ